MKQSFEQSNILPAWESVRGLIGQPLVFCLSKREVVGEKETEKPYYCFRDSTLNKKDEHWNKSLFVLHSHATSLATLFQTHTIPVPTN